MKELVFDAEEALDQFASVVSDVIGARISSGRFVRDVFGRSSFVTGSELSEDEHHRILATLNPCVKPFVTADPIVQSRSPLVNSIVEEPGLVRHIDGKDVEFRLIDRRLAGDDWIRQPRQNDPITPRFAFYGLKGGVGRSTALSICAADLATLGKNVLVVDLDLEAPGLASFLLSPDQLPEYGVLDWLAAGSVGLEVGNLVPDLIGGSPLTQGAGIVDVVPVCGISTIRQPLGFLSKLARAYTPGAVVGRLSGLSFTQKIEELLSDLCSYRRYDAVLLDVRAGLHESSAAGLLGLGAHSFLFGTNSPQTILGYNFLFSNIRQVMESWPGGPDLRGRFRMVHGRASNSISDRNEYRAACWKLWLDTLYDSVGADGDLVR